MENLTDIDALITESQGQNRATILIVDDEERIRKVIALQLEKVGYTVIALDDGAQAMELLGQVDIDLIISDIRMPSISGNQILKYVLTHAPTVPVIILTGIVEVETAVDVMKNGAYHYLVKPVKREELLLTVHRALQHRALQLRNLRLQEENRRYQRELEKSVRDRTAQLAKALANLRNVHMNTVKILASAIEEKDPYMKGHSNRVRVLASALARQMGYREMEIERIEFGALLHDIGKIAIDQRILDKPSPLTIEEHNIIHEHPIIGERIIAKVNFFNDIAPMIRWHHERWDGTGYPDGKKGEELPVPARILILVDAFDAMTSDRSYRGALMFDTVLEIIRDERGKQFCPEIVDLFLEEEIYRTPLID